MRSDLVLVLERADGHECHNDDQSTETLYGANLCLEDHDICHEAVDDDSVTDKADITCGSIFESLSKTDTTNSLYNTEKSQVEIDGWVLGKDFLGTRIVDTH